MAINNIKNRLLQIDFSSNDADVYIALIDLRQTPVGAIITKTGLHRNIVYTSLEHLLRRKLVEERTIRGIKHFSAVNPSLLVEEFAKKQEISKEVSQEILKNLVYSHVQEITIHQGNDEYLNLLRDLIKNLPKGATKYVLGSGGEPFMKNTMRPLWKKYHKTALEQGIKIKMLSYKSQRQSIVEDTKNPDIYEVKYLSDSIENPAGLHIYPEIDTVLNIIYSNDMTPVTAIKIKNKALTQGYMNLFNNLWKQAE